MNSSIIKMEIRQLQEKYPDFFKDYSICIIRNDITLREFLSKK